VIPPRPERPSSFPSSPAETSAASLEAVLDRLAASPQVDGVLLMGSAAAGNVQPHSDYDLVVVINGFPAGLIAINTCIDHRFTEVFFYSVHEVREIASRNIVRAASHEDWLVGWLHDGRIICDKSGALGALQARVSGISSDISFADTYSAWHKASYNLAANLRYWASSDEAYLEALDLRLQYSAVEAFTAYFTVRRIRWEGERHAMEWLHENDPGFLALFQKHLQSATRAERLATYEGLVHAALDPLGAPWPVGITTPGLSSSNFTEKDLRDALDFWSGLLV
jgi:predicted nucleotidyltransferase